MIYTGIITIQKTTNALNNTCLKYFCTLKGTRVLTTSSRHINAIASIKGQLEKQNQNYTLILKKYMIWEYLIKIHY